MNWTDSIGNAWTTGDHPVRSGGQGEIFRTTDGRHAVKAAKPGQEDFLRREVSALAELVAEHPGLEDSLVVPRASGESPRPFLVLDWYDLDAARWLSPERSLAERLGLAEACCRAVVALHWADGERARNMTWRFEGGGEQKGRVVHRDIKPGNFLLREEGGALVARLIDFGAVRTSDARTVTMATQIYTEGFAPLEQTVPRRVVPEVSWDVYALGATVFWILTGSLPLGCLGAAAALTPRGQDLQSLHRQLQARPGASSLQVKRDELAALPLRDLIDFSRLQPLISEDEEELVGLLGPHSVELIRDLRRALAARPQDRMTDARDLLQRVRALQGQTSTPAPGPAPVAVLHTVTPVRHVAVAGGRTVMPMPAPSPAPRPPPSPSPPRTGSLRLPALAVGGILVASGGMWWWSGSTAELALTVTGEVPEWGMSAVLVDGRPARLEDGVWRIGGVPRGKALTVKRLGGVDEDGDGLPDRCAWEATAEVTGAAESRVELGAVRACPTEEWRSPMVPVPSTTDLPAFGLGKVEVSQGLWTAVTGMSPPAEHCPSYEGESLVGDDLPVHCIDWCDAVLFANDLSQAEGLSPAYELPAGFDYGMDACADAAQVVKLVEGSTGYRLPTVAEWMHAGRAGGHELYAGTEDVALLGQYGNVMDQTGKARFPGWPTVPNNDGYATLAPVGALAGNAWGLHDMTGNVHEWAWDAAPEGTRSWVSSRWSNQPKHATLDLTGSRSPAERRNDIGLRLTRSGVAP